MLLFRSNCFRLVLLEASLLIVCLFSFRFWPASPINVVSSSSYPLPTKAPSTEKARAFQNLIDETIQQYQKVYQRAPAKGYRKWLKFASKHRCLLDPRHYSQIDDDLRIFRDPKDPNRKSISKEQQEGVAKMKFADPMQFVEGRLVRPKEGLWYSFLNPIASIFVDYNFTVYINNRDEPRIVVPDDDPAVPYQNSTETIRRSKCLRETFGAKNGKTVNPYSLHSFFLEPVSFDVETRRVPIFSQCKTPCYDDIIIPALYHFDIPPCEDVYSWKDKKNGVLWRGSTTGGKINSRGAYKQYPRFRFLDWSRHLKEREPSFPLTVDTAFTDNPGCDLSDCLNVLNQSYRWADHIRHKEHYGYKYLPVIDGNALASRLQRFLYGHSLVLTNGIFLEWFSKWILPSVHYVRFDLDCSDLREKLLWLHDNGAEAEKIALTSSEFSRQRMRLEDQQCYTALAFLEYADLLE